MEINGLGMGNAIGRARFGKQSQIAGDMVVRQQGELALAKFAGQTASLAG
jgi:hypothetical protein